MTKPIRAAVTAAALCLAGTAQAQHAHPSATIRTADLNLGHPSGLATFRGRVKAAVNRVCGIAPAQPLDEARAVAECRAEASRAAEARIRTGTASVEVTGTH